MGAKKKLYTLTEVSQETGISMPTLQKYKKQHAERIPSVGEGRKQRYTKEAFAVFKQLKQDGLKSRGGARRSKASKRTRRTRARGRASDQGLLSLQRIKEVTGISYPTLLRYTKLHLDQIPHVGDGRTRRFAPESVAVFQRLRSESPRGRRKGSGRTASPVVGPRATGDGGMEKRLAGLERAHLELQKEIRTLVKMLQKPVSVTIKR